MEENTLQQKLQIARHGFPVGCKVCNYKIGTVGIVTGEPFVDLHINKVFLSVEYGNREFLEDAEGIFRINTVKKGVSRHS